ncbi:hypothetical protein [Ferrimonas kyonanensis]|uniref:hypothetical protein n=1 Tax=Ferrimonas kyonanensis TaxID=364763 RepID=UPI0004036E5D|nr:hypothetical protein [Ferrimonas kyonanensis]
MQINNNQLMPASPLKTTATAIGQEAKNATSTANVHKQQFDSELNKLVELNQEKSAAFIKSAQQAMNMQGSGSLSNLIGGGSADLEDLADKMNDVRSGLADRQQSMIANPGSGSNSQLLSMLGQARSALL